MRQPPGTGTGWELQNFPRASLTRSGSIRGRLEPSRLEGAVSASHPDPASGRELAVPRFTQPDDVTCGPTCLLSVLRYYGDQTSFAQLLELTPTNPDGGTLAVFLGQVARALGYRARLYSYNYRVVDPTWSELAPSEVRARLLRRAEVSPKPKVQAACRAYAEFLAAGGELAFADLSPELLVGALERGHPVLCGLSATYLYEQPRERPDDNATDDVGGDPVGHFLVICGYAAGGARFSVRDPFSHVPATDESGSYAVEARRLLNAILLGIVSYDAVLLEVWPADEGSAEEGA